MKEERLKEQLQQILQAEVRRETRTVKEWKAMGGSRTSGDWYTSVKIDDTLYVPTSLEGSSISLLAITAGGWSQRERDLVEFIVDNSYNVDKRQSLKSEHERFVAAVRDWIEERAASGSPDDQDPPVEVTRHSALFGTKVPFLVYGEYTSSNQEEYKDMKKLLETFFDGDILLIPLMDKEWLVLGSESLLTDADEEEGSAESAEEQLASLCLGLQAVISTEGAGDCHVSAYYPITPVQTLPSTVIKLREAISIGRLQHAGQYIHLPWELYLDQLLSPLSHSDRLKFIEQVFKRKDPQLDRETIQTLETFFELDCNVSETAKHLYIHRNTLLYRLDKFKQESGLDVRTFNQAVHVKLALQLYKVTKRL